MEDDIKKLLNGEYPEDSLRDFIVRAVTDYDREEEKREGTRYSVVSAEKIDLGLTQHCERCAQTFEFGKNAGALFYVLRYDRDHVSPDVVAYVGEDDFLVVVNILMDVLAQTVEAQKVCKASAKLREGYA